MCLGRSVLPHCPSMKLSETRQRTTRKRNSRRPFNSSALLPRRCAVVVSAQQSSQQLQRFPLSYSQAMRQAQEATKAALADGIKLLEVEFPSASLESVPGDGEGQNEMNWSMGYMREYLQAFRERAAGIRIFFPDDQEVAVARSGQTADPAAGRAAFDAKFEESSRFQMGYLTKQGGIAGAAWAVLGVNLLSGGFRPSQLAKAEDEMFVVAYPSFNPREELTATEDLWREAAQQQGRPLLIFNGELDRIRDGYYPALFFPEIARVARDFLSRFEAVYYIRNFKGTSPGVLFRAYPGPWQVLRRNPMDLQEMRLVWTGDKKPTLRQVATEILPSSK